MPINRALGNIMEGLQSKYQIEISKILTDGFEKELLNAAFTNLLVPNPLQFNNFGYALRELIRHVLHRLAPNDEIKACAWFKPDPTSRNGFTRKQRIKYAIQGGLSDFYIKSKLGIDDVDEVSKELLGIIDLLNSYTHIELHTFDISTSEVYRLANECLNTTVSFVDKITEIRSNVIDAIVEDVDRSLVEKVLMESVEEVMELSTHQHIDDIYSEESRVIKIGASSLQLDVKGTVECELLYGSASDRRRDDGASISESFPIQASLNVVFQAPLGSSIDVKSLNVDTSSWYE